METVIIHALWFVFGAACMFVVIVAIAPVILSSRISQWQEAQAPTWTQEYQEPQAPVVSATESGELAEAQAKAQFYYRMATDDK